MQPRKVSKWQKFLMILGAPLIFFGFWLFVDELKTFLQGVSAEEPYALVSYASVPLTVMTILIIIMTPSTIMTISRRKRALANGDDDRAAQVTKGYSYLLYASLALLIVSVFFAKSFIFPVAENGGYALCAKEKKRGRHPNTFYLFTQEDAACAAFNQTGRKPRDFYKEWSGARAEK